MPFSVAAEVMSVGLQWVAWFLGGAVGGFVTLLSAVAVAHAYRRRHRTPPTAAMPSPESAGVAAGATTSSSLSPGSVVIGYVPVAADPWPGEDGESASAIKTMCERSGWELLEIVRDSDKGRSLERPGLRHALERILAGDAKGLVMNDLERLSRSIVDLGALMAWFRDAGATLVVLDLDIDTSTPEGCHVANTLIALSAREHERIAAGTREGLAKGRASGHATGRPAVSHRPELVERIGTMRAAKMTLSAIAEQLNAEGVPTLRGGKKWRPSSIQAALGYRRPGGRDRLPSPHA
jgi:DNA invertase Pin-like site-specific DNA recombinase